MDQKMAFCCQDQNKARHLEAISLTTWETADEKKQVPVLALPKSFWVLFLCSVLKSVHLPQKKSIRKFGSCFSSLGTG